MHGTIWIGGWSKRCSVSKERDTIHPGAWPPVRAEQEEEQRDEAVVGFVGLVALPSFPLACGPPSAPALHLRGAFLVHAVEFRATAGYYACIVASASRPGAFLCIRKDGGRRGTRTMDG
jgi:hypothetical protein